MNGCSDFIVSRVPQTYLAVACVSFTRAQVKVLGEKGRHARAAVGATDIDVPLSS